MTTEDHVISGRDVSRETMARLVRYEELLRKWNPAINLVARSTIKSIWERHFRDSIQVFDLAPESATSWADLGSGGGFPGMVAAILAAEERPHQHVTLVESDQRKAAFLATVARETGVSATVISKRIEDVEPLGVDILSARALAPLTQLLEYAHRHLASGGVALFPKGAAWREEVQVALESWRFSYENKASVTDPAATVLTIGGISRV
ncbi:16S rRNA (guanine(527)-N(7))-methyltransferase RsmG [Defluviimonas sp. WL0050]|uniref:Ribosomal RNA small subunit methyltransferase G n=1 Tax=Albidovulum litorale TaxID=2984134 RepID=A0ABT2ZP65_9RHOB|nr:16S rRNA (guanine(527)-N(7))-methyltransferase RsmG [Defluviimonas sp. WL0050]MCV2872551.1 16S rRNA (guanine(527)-N(7))-methyltransferase RsmG [Defluviimonas sp. WL0050]